MKSISHSLRNLAALWENKACHECQVHTNPPSCDFPWLSWPRCLTSIYCHSTVKWSRECVRGIHYATSCLIISTKNAVGKVGNGYGHQMDDDSGSFGCHLASFRHNGSIFPFHCHSSKCHVTVVLCGGQHRHAQSSHHHGQGPGSRVRPSVARGPPSCQLSGRRSYAIIWYHWYHRYMVERLPLKHCFWRIDCIGVCLLCNPRSVSNHVKAPELATLGAVWAWHQIYRTLVVQVRRFKSVKGQPSETSTDWAAPLAVESLDTTWQNHTLPWMC